jgi:hypothetical protein
MSNARSKKHDKEMFGTKELLSLKYPNKQKRLIYQIPVSLSLSV